MKQATVAVVLALLVGGCDESVDPMDEDMSLGGGKFDDQDADGEPGGASAGDDDDFLSASQKCNELAAVDSDKSLGRAVQCFEKVNRAFAKEVGGDELLNALYEMEGAVYGSCAVYYELVDLAYSEGVARPSETEALFGTNCKAHLSVFTNTVLAKWGAKVSKDLRFPNLQWLDPCTESGRDSLSCADELPKVFFEPMTTSYLDEHPSIAAYAPDALGAREQMDGPISAFCRALPGETRNDTTECILSGTMHSLDFYNAMLRRIGADFLD